MNEKNENYRDTEKKEDILPQRHEGTKKIKN